MKRARIGDVVEIRVSDGFSYALYTHHQPKFGALLRVFERVWSSRPTAFQEVVQDAIRFEIFFPLEAALKGSILEVVDHQDIPATLKPFPTFRSGMIDPSTKKVAVWWLWDGEKEWRIGELTSDQRRLPIRGVWNDTMLVGRIESDWRVEHDPR